LLVWGSWLAGVRLEWVEPTGRPAAIPDLSPRLPLLHLAPPPPSQTPTPTRQLRSLNHVKHISLGFQHSLAVGSHGKTATWGTDEGGSLGQGFRWPSPSARTPQSLPVRLVSGAAGWRHCAGVDGDGRLFAWGWGGAVGAGGLLSPNQDLGAGQLGLGSDRDAHAPRQLHRLLLGRSGFRDLRQSVGPGAGLWRALGVSCGRNHTAAVVEVEVQPCELAGG